MARHRIILNSATSQLSVTCPWKAEYVVVTNATPVPLYVRVGARDFPDERNYDTFVPGGASRPFPAYVQEFGLSLGTGSAVAGGIANFTSKCEVLFIKGELPPVMSGFDLPPPAQQLTGTLNNGASASVIIDARGFNSLYVSLTPGTFNAPMGLLVESATGDAPAVWSGIQAFRVQSGTRIPFARVFPTGGGFVRLSWTNRHSAPQGYTLNYRPIKDIWAGVNDQTQRTVYAGHYQTAALAAGVSDTALLWQEFSGIVEEITVRIEGFNAAPPSIGVAMVDENIPRVVMPIFGEVTPAAGIGRVFYGVALPLLMESATGMYHWRLAPAIPFKRALSIAVQNLGTADIDTVNLSYRLSVEA